MKNKTRHIVIVLSILILQFFITDIVGYIWNSSLKHEYLKKSEAGEGTFFKKAEEYSSTVKDLDNALAECSWIYINTKDKMLDATCFSEEHREKIVVIVRNNEVSEYATNSYPFLFYMIIPILGGILSIVALVLRARRNVLRTIANRKAGRTELEPKLPFNSFEKLLFIYGIPLFLSSIVFGMLGRW